MAAEGLDPLKIKEVENLFNRLKQAKEQANTLKNELTSIKDELEVLSQTEIFRQYVNKTDGARRLCTPNAGGEPSCKRNKYDFSEVNGYVVVYTDGACEHNGRYNAKAGFGVWWGDNHALNIAKPVKGPATNNTAEIQACVYALQVAIKYDIKKLKIITDSQFVINAMTKWIIKWKKNNWRLAGSSKPVKNKADFEDLDILCENIDVQWEHVYGHVGVKGNEEADKLAKEGATLYKPQD